ncbi:MAG: hypothetical protein KBB86_00110 [Candidatus Pacebacteria bacterium]|nr:hypothetical protein [Candidatus Paceibacterota bacterium]
MEKKNIWISAISAMFAVHIIGCTGLMNVHVAILVILHIILGLIFGFLVNFYYSEKNQLWFFISSVLLIVLTVAGFSGDSLLLNKVLKDYAVLIAPSTLTFFCFVGHYIDKIKLLRA